MKKRLRVLVVILIIVMSFSSCGIIKQGLKDVPTEWDGQFLYYYIASEDSYAIVGMTKTLGEEYKGEVKDRLYIPTHYKGKPIKYTYYAVYDNSILGYGYNGTPVGISAYAHKFYLSYLVKPYQMKASSTYKYWANYDAKEIYIVDTNRACYYRTMGSGEIVNCDVYYTRKLYDIIVEIETKEDVEFMTNNSYTFTTVINNYNHINEMRIISANTAYMFNYEDSPNEDYFFINNFERGGKIENTPYEPIRDGYTFTGWYKDEGCTQKWNFDADTLPNWEYDEDGNEIYVETKLYAGWSKNN